MKRVNLVEFSEVVAFGNKKGHSWNELCDKLDFLRPTDGDGTRDWHISEFDLENDDYTEDKEMIQLMIDFFTENKVEEIVIAED